MLIPRPYQQEGINIALDFFNKPKKFNGLQVYPTGAGKSVVIACIVKELTGKTLVFQPSKEILEQNFKKFISYGGRAGIYSDSAGMKFVDNVTFVTIGSVINKLHLFRSFTNIIIDECHLVNAEEGMYQKFLSSLPNAKVLGLTATPYRLEQTMNGPMLKFITRTNPRIFNKLLYVVQTSVLFETGSLAPIRYFDKTKIDRSMLQKNSAGTDFSEASLRDYYRKNKTYEHVIDLAKRICKVQPNLLTFAATIDDGKKIAKATNSPILTGETAPDLRSSLLKDFKAGNIQHLVNVGVLTTGFDYPALTTTIIGRSTMSLSLYYQIIGRVMRPFTYPDGKKKEGWVLDIGGNIEFFGRIEDMRIEADEKGLWAVYSKNKQLTNVALEK